MNILKHLFFTLFAAILGSIIFMPVNAMAKIEETWSITTRNTRE